MNERQKGSQEIGGKSAFKEEKITRKRRKWKKTEREIGKKNKEQIQRER